MPDLTLFAFDDAMLRTHVDEAGTPWFVAKDLCNLLDIEKYRDAVSRLDEDERGSVLVDTLGGQQEMACVSESGLYSLVFRSRKPEARRFRRWVTAEVLPALRKTGGYHVGAAQVDITPRRLRDLVAVWAMLSDMPRPALLDQVLTLHGIEDSDTASPAALRAAGGYVLQQNARFLEGAPRVSQRALQQYEDYRRGLGEEPPLVTAFWQQFHELNDSVGGGLNHSASPSMLAVNLPEFLRLSTERGLFAFNAPELRRLLPHSKAPAFLAGNKGTRSRKAGKVLKCWVFLLAPGEPGGVSQPTRRTPTGTPCNPSEVAS